MPQLLTEQAHDRFRTVQQGVYTKRLLRSLGTALIVIASAFYLWSEKTADGKRLPAFNGVEIHIASGDVEIVGKPVAEIRVTIEGVSPEIARTASVRIRRDRKPNLLDISNLPQISHAYIEVPDSSNLAIFMRAGDLKIESVHGDKYALLRAGSMTIDVGPIANYGSADGFVLSGRLKASAFEVDKGGIWRRFHWTGPGRSTIDAHVTSGELNLE
jgi:hypothetical protein